MLSSHAHCMLNSHGVIKHNHVCNTLISKKPMSCPEAGHILPNCLKKQFLFFFRCNLSIKSEIQHFYNTSTPSHLPNCHKILTGDQGKVMGESCSHGILVAFDSVYGFSKFVNLPFNMFTTKE